MKPTMRFLRHDGIYRPMVSSFLKNLGRSTAPRPDSAQAVKDAPEVLRPTHRRDEFRPVIPQRVARQCGAHMMGQNGKGTWSDNGEPVIGGSRPAMQWCSVEPVRPVWPRVAWSEQW